ncbi:hypothetical protein C8Q76DRAFT_744073 [Earliella scabrosa]|nr:hypothetical protein C8Q76DRAFT_744073 [Earliella scabrosa]
MPVYKYLPMTLMLVHSIPPGEAPRNILLHPNSSEASAWEHSRQHKLWNGSRLQPSTSMLLSNLSHG